MRPGDLPQRWKTSLKDYLTRQHGVTREYLSVDDFINESTKITFEDGSSVTFRYTLFLESLEFEEIAVFTEHCGYHIFSLGSVETVDHSTKS